MVSSAFSHHSPTTLTSHSKPIYFTSLSVSLYSYRNPIKFTSLSLFYLIPIPLLSNTTQNAQQNVHQDTFNPSSLSPSIISAGLNKPSPCLIPSLENASSNQLSLSTTSLHMEGSFRIFYSPSQHIVTNTLFLEGSNTRSSNTSHLLDQTLQQTQRAQNDECANY